MALELTLKDDDETNYADGHDVIEMVSKRGHPALTPLAVALHDALEKLWCTDRDRRTRLPIQSTVDPSNFPHIRYLRHEGDYPGTTTDGDLAVALDALENLWLELDTQGVKAC